MASYLPDSARPPELGPKMYIAYGTGVEDLPSSIPPGTTHLHQDVADAINIMLYCVDSKEVKKKKNVYFLLLLWCNRGGREKTSKKIICL